MVQGDIVPCCNYKIPLVVGNVMQQSAYDIFHGGKLNDFRRHLLLGNRKDNEACRDCQTYRYRMYEEEYLDTTAEVLLSKYDEF